MVDLGLGNSRMKDFFGIWFLCKNFEFEASTLAAAIHSTFSQRRTPPLPDMSLDCSADSTLMGLSPRSHVPGAGASPWPARRTMTTAIKLREVAYPSLFAAAA